MILTLTLKVKLIPMFLSNIVNQNNGVYLIG